MHRSGSGEPELRSPASNRDNRDNLENPAHLWLQALGHAGERGGLSPAPAGWVLCGKKNSTSKEKSNVIYWFMSENFMGYLLKCYWFFMLGYPNS